MSPVHNLLHKRAHMYAKVRNFFSHHHVLEVDCSHLLSVPQLDAHIDVMSVDMGNGHIGYLHTSPEYSMKKLLAKGAPDIYQISKVYRQEEVGKKHHPEFTMIEWYRTKFSLEQLIQETKELISLFLPSTYVFEHMCYTTAFQKFAYIHPFTASLQELQSRANSSLKERDVLLDLIMANVVEKNFPENTLLCIDNFPKEKAALSQLHTHNGQELAQRFEMYYQGLELANGYQELTCQSEHRKRFLLANEQRKLRGQKTYPIDEEFITCLSTLPDCCGVSVGFDRLMMISLSSSSIEQVLPSPSLFL